MENTGCVVSKFCYFIQNYCVPTDSENTCTSELVEFVSWFQFWLSPYSTGSSIEDVAARSDGGMRTGWSVNNRGPNTGWRRSQHQLEAIPTPAGRDPNTGWRRSQHRLDAIPTPAGGDPNTGWTRSQHRLEAIPTLTGGDPNTGWRRSQHRLEAIPTPAGGDPNTGWRRSQLAPQGGIAPNQVIARSDYEVHRSNVYGVNVTKAVIGAYM